MGFRVVTINVNGIRAAVRKGFLEWLEYADADVIALQETRAPLGMVAELLGPTWTVHETVADQAGRAGVAIASRHRLIDIVDHLDAPGANTTGRWIEASVDTPSGTPLRVVCTYVHTGDAGSPERMAEKHTFLRAGSARSVALAATDQAVLWCGDFNVAHQWLDIKNHKGNVGRAGFLPEEQAHLTAMIDDHGWVDLGRYFAGEVPGPYTWWTYRGQAYDNDAGWRIDLHLASPALAPRAKSVDVDRSMTYAQRWSDHGPVVATFDL